MVYSISASFLSLPYKVNLFYDEGHLFSHSPELNKYLL
jgi:hypothetical protein